jgi:GTP-binding protein
VPLGTVVRDKETGEILFEITENGEKQVPRGGKGGLGTGILEVLQIKPRYAQPGLPGSEMDVILNLRFWLT